MSSATATADTPPAAAPGLPGGSITTLVSGILDDGQRLFKQQVEMVKVEVKDELSRTKNIAIYLGVGIGLAAVGAVMLLVAFVYLIQYLTQWHLAGCWGLVAGVTLLAAAIALVVGSRLLAKFNPIPQKSINALQENVQCLTNPS